MLRILILAAHPLQYNTIQYNTISAVFFLLYLFRNLFRYLFSLVLFPLRISFGFQKEQRCRSNVAGATLQKRALGQFIYFQIIMH